MEHATNSSILFPLFILAVGGVAANTNNNYITTVNFNPAYQQTYSSIHNRDMLHNDDLANAHDNITSLLSNLKNTPPEFNQTFLENIENLLA